MIFHADRRYFFKHFGCVISLFLLLYNFIMWCMLTCFLTVFVYRYSYLSSWQIKQIPVSMLAAPDCLVVTWVTNRQKHLRFVKDELYPHWSVKTLAEWHWVKVSSLCYCFLGNRGVLQYGTS